MGGEEVISRRLRHRGADDVLADRAGSGERSWSGEPGNLIDQCPRARASARIPLVSVAGEVVIEDGGGDVGELGGLGRGELVEEVPSDRRDVQGCCGLEC